MTIWEKAIVNIERGARKLSAGAALFSERVRAEIAIARLRIRLDEAKASINDQYRIIGRRIAEMRKKEEFPAIEQLLQEEEMTAAFAAIAESEKELSDIQEEIAGLQSALAEEEKPVEETGL